PVASSICAWFAVKIILALTRLKVSLSDPMKAEAAPLSTFAVPESLAVLFGPERRIATSANPEKKASLDARLRRLRLTRPSTERLLDPASVKALVPLMVIFEPPP